MPYEDELAQRSKRFFFRRGIGRELVIKWLPLLSALLIGYYVGNALVFETVPKRFVLAMVFGSLFLMVAWRREPVVILVPTAFIIWYQSMSVSYSFLEPILFDATFAELGIYSALIVYIMKNGIRSFRFLLSTPHIKLLGLFILCSVMPFFIGVAPDWKFSWTSMRWCVLAPTALYLMVLGLKKQEHINKILAAFLYGSLVLSVISIFAFTGYIGQAPWLGNNMHIGDVGRLYGAYQVPLLGYMLLGGNLTVIFSSYAIPISLSFFLHSKGQKRRQTILMCVFVLNVIAVIIGGSRSVWIGALVGSVMVILLSRRKMKKGMMARIVIVTFALAMTFVVLSQMGYLGGAISDRGTLMLKGMFSPRDYLEFLQDSEAVRITIWKQIIPVMISFPFGTGFMDSFAPAGGVDLGPHSQYLFLLLGTGIAGTALFLLFLGLCLKKCSQGRVMDEPLSRSIAIGSVGAICAYFFNAVMIHTVLAVGTDMILLAICAAGLSAVKQPGPSLMNQ